MPRPPLRVRGLRSGGRTLAPPDSGGGDGRDWGDAAAEACALCGRPLFDAPVEGDAGRFCCAGCRDVEAAVADAGADELGGVETDEVAGGRTNEVADAGANEDETAGVADRDGTDRDGASSPAAPDAARTYLALDGVHSATGEAYLEAVAREIDGVRDAEASYVTQTVRVEHDPERASVADLCEALTTLGYRARPRDADGGAAGPAAGGRSSTATDVGSSSNATGTGESTPAATGAGSQSSAAGAGRRRGFDDTLDFRYAVGVLFGSFLLVPYVAVLYPAHISAFVEWGPFARYGGAVAFDGSGGLLFVHLAMIVTGIVLAFTGMPLLREAYAGLRTGRPTTALLVSLTLVGAYCYSAIAAVVGRTDVYFDLAVVVAAVVVGAVFYESLWKRRAMDRLTDLTRSRTDRARLLDGDGSTRSAPVADLSADDRVLVRAGERVPVDATLAEGTCTVDESVVTGESLPVEKRAGDPLVGGSVVADGAAVATVTEGATSRIDALATAVWDVQSAEHGAQRRGNALAARVAPLVVGGAVLVGAAALARGGGPVSALLAGLTVLLVGSPWALGLATPLSVAATLRAALERGIVVFDETVFERLRDVDVVVFDKTGTLTTGEMTVLDADAPDDLLALAGVLERRGSHPAAAAIAAAFDPAEAGDERRTAAEGDAQRTAAEGDEGRTTDEDGVGRTAVEGDAAAPGAVDVTSFQGYANGVRGTVAGTDVLVGNLACFRDRGWDVEEGIEDRVRDARGLGRLPVVVGRDGRAAGVVVVGDDPREGWADTVARLAEDARVVVLTGDDAAPAETFEGHVGVDSVFAGVPPEGKTAAVERLGRGNTVAMVGDGTNDAPALAAADLGITLGSATALAAEAADLAIVDDDLDAVESAFALSRTARRRVRENVALALGYNALAVPLALAGLLNPVFLMGAVVATCALLAANAARVPGEA